jgi:OOP family OmpA-OmpF porin
MIRTKYSMAAGVALLGLAVAGNALSQPARYEGDAYAVSAATGAVAKNPYGLCWRTSAWTPAKAIAECDPALVAKPTPRPQPAQTVVAPAPAPVVVAPAPAPVVVARVIDTDGDGVPDERDRCPGTVAGAVVNAQGCELDSDADGVVDRLDRCAGTPAGRKVDAVGCEIAEVIILKGVTFATNSARLTPDSAKTLDAAAATLVKRGNVKTEIAGHTDDRGSATHNRSLSQQRAEAVMKYLVSKGVAPASLSARGYGEDAPIASNASESGRSQNRRVELRAQ